MADNPSDIWYWNDWDNDVELKLVSLAAQGVWMRCLSICSRSTPRGYLKRGDRILTAVDMAKIIGRPVDEIGPLLDELVSGGVASKDRNGCIYSRRIVRLDMDHKAREKGGKKAGRANVREQRGIFASVDTSMENEPMPPPRSLIPLPITHTQESSSLRSEDSCELEGELFPEQVSKPINGNGAHSKPRAFLGVELPDWIPDEVWKGFVDMRTRIKAPLTARATKLLVARLDRFRVEGHDPAAIIDQSTMQSWRGVFEVKPTSFAQTVPGNARRIITAADYAEEGKPDVTH